MEGTEGDSSLPFLSSILAAQLPTFSEHQPIYLPPGSLEANNSDLIGNAPCRHFIPILPVSSFFASMLKLK